MSTVAEKKPGCALVPQADIDRIVELDAFCKSSVLAIQAAHDSGSDMQKALVTARSINGIRQRLTKEVMVDIMSLQGSALGFKTDRDNDGGYPLEKVREAIIAALLKGLRVTGNEINIIAGNLYETVHGIGRLVKEFPGVTDLNIQMGVPVLNGPETLLVSARAEWRYNGRAMEVVCSKGDEMDTRIAVRITNKGTVDNYIGKAKSKLYRRIYERLTGSELSNLDDDIPAESAKIAFQPEEELPTVVGSLEDAISNAELGYKVTVKGVADGEIVPEELPAEFLAELQKAIEAAKTPEQLANALAFWLQKATNRNLTLGQKATIQALFDRS
jgi:hypothetical protein